MNPILTNPHDLELAVVDPKSIVVDANVRTLVEIDPAFYDSIRDHGVQSPPTCWRDADGTVHAVRGQRRVVAAAKAGLPEIPVIVIPEAQAAAEQDRERDRIVGQIVENDQRQALTDSERRVAFEQLTLFGMSADEIARATKTKRETVRNAVKLSKSSPATAELMAEKQLTIDDALLLAEFENDPEERAELEETIEESPHLVQCKIAELKQARARRVAIAEVRVEADAAGVPWVDPGKVNRWDSPFVQLKNVRIGKAAEAPTVEEALQQGGLVASALEHRAWEAGVVTESYSLGYWIDAPKDHGYRVPRAGAVEQLSEKEQEKRRKERAAKKETKAAWGAACEARQTWIRDVLLAAENPPEGVRLWLLKAQVGHYAVYNADPSSAGKESARALALTWLDGEPEPREETWQSRRIAFLKLAERRNPAIVSLAYTIACAEHAAADPKSYEYGTARSIGGYLQQLEAWGYVLTKIEEDLVQAWTKANAASIAAEAGEA